MYTHSSIHTHTHKHAHKCSWIRLLYSPYSVWVLVCAYASCLRLLCLLHINMDTLHARMNILSHCVICVYFFAISFVFFYIFASNKHAGRRIHNAQHCRHTSKDYNCTPPGFVGNYCLFMQVGPTFCLSQKLWHQSLAARLLTQTHTHTRAQTLNKYCGT